MNIQAFTVHRAQELYFVRWLSKFLQKPLEMVGEFILKGKKYH